MKPELLRGDHPNLDLCFNIAEHLDGDGEHADLLDRFSKFDLSTGNLDTGLSDGVGNVTSGHRTVETIAFDNAAFEVDRNLRKLGSDVTSGGEFLLELSFESSAVGFNLELEFTS